MFLGCSGAAFGMLLGRFCWDVLGQRVFGTVLGRSGADAFGMCLGCFWDVLGMSLGCSLGCAWDVLGAFLGRFWDVVGSLGVLG